jgi:hypothetical protein
MIQLLDLNATMVILSNLTHLIHIPVISATSQDLLKEDELVQRAVTMINVLIVIIAMSLPKCSRKEIRRNRNKKILTNRLKC